ncbi:hypothetical protein CR513_26911, partial [Mucuna pruriens]
MKHPVEDTSLFGIDLINKLDEEHMQADIGSTEFFQVVGNTNILDCLGSVFEEHDYDEPWEVHDAKVTTALAHLDHNLKIRNNEKSEHSKHSEVQAESGRRPKARRPQESTPMWPKKTRSRPGSKLKQNRPISMRSNQKPGSCQQPKYQTPTKWAKQFSDQHLKPLSNHLKYAYLGDEQQFLVLRQHNKAIWWKLSDLPRINPSICMHRILMEEEAHPIRQQQRRLNPTILDVVKKE